LKIKLISLFLVISIVLSLITSPTLAKENQTNGQPFNELTEIIDTVISEVTLYFETLIAELRGESQASDEDLQQQIDAIEIVPPDISELEARVASLEAEIIELQNQAALPSLTINDVTLTEADAGTQEALFTVTLSEPTNETVTFIYSTADGTATSGQDYEDTSGSRVILPGELNTTFSISIINDQLVENSENLFVNLNNVFNATPPGPSQVTIIDNDEVSLTIDNLSVAEGNSGTTLFTFQVTKEKVSPSPVSVQYQTEDGTAIAGEDYTSASGEVIFPAYGATPSVQTITVEVIGDLSVEYNERFYINLSSPAGAVIADDQAIGIIVNDDLPTLSINDVSAAEGNSGYTPFEFTVTISEPVSNPVRFYYDTVWSLISAKPGEDYVRVYRAVGIIDPGTTSKTITVNVIGDTKYEPDENFAVKLSLPGGLPIVALSKRYGAGIIVNDDPALSINDVRAPEGDSGLTPFVFTVTLSPVSSSTVTVIYRLDYDFSSTNQEDLIYPTDLNPLVFQPGESVKTITVNVKGDTITESTETFTVSLVSPINAAIRLGMGRGRGTIENDD